MFPEIVRDEVFRIESRRLWLRWPMAADAFDAFDADPTAVSVPQTATIGKGYSLPGRACIAAWRDEMERGTALHLMLEEKVSGRPTIGTVHLAWARDGSVVIDYRLAAGRRGEGLMTEAIQAVINTVFLMHLASSVTAAPAATDRKGRDVLERSGFTYAGSGMRPCPSGPGLAACDHFRLDRRTWLSLQGWGLSGRRLAPRLTGGQAPGVFGLPAHV